jgi:hypothetical protein
MLGCGSISNPMGHEESLDSLKIRQGLRHNVNHLICKMWLAINKKIGMYLNLTHLTAIPFCDHVLVIYLCRRMYHREGRCLLFRHHPAINQRSS